MSSTFAPAQTDQWLPVLVERLGPPEKDPDLARWTWQDDELGVFVDKLTHAWQAVAWSPSRSATLRSLERPSGEDMLRLVRLVGLNEALR